MPKALPTAKQISLNPAKSRQHLSARDGNILTGHAVLIMEQYGARVAFYGYHKRRQRSRWLVQGKMVEKRGPQDYDYIGVNAVGSLRH